MICFITVRFVPIALAIIHNNCSSHRLNLALYNQGYKYQLSGVRYLISTIVGLNCKYNLHESKYAFYVKT